MFSEEIKSLERAYNSHPKKIKNCGYAQIIQSFNFNNILGKRPSRFTSQIAKIK